MCARVVCVCVCVCVRVVVAPNSIVPSYCGARFELCPSICVHTRIYTEERECGLFFFYELQPVLVISRSVNSISSRSFCKKGHNGLFKILGGCHVVWVCEAQIPRGGTYDSCLRECAP